MGCENKGGGLSSTKINPNPAFEVSVAGATQLEFRSGGNPEEDRRIILITDSTEIREFIESIKFEVYPEGMSIHCYCDGDPHIVVHVGSNSQTEFTLHHSKSIRWDAYDETDLRLTEASIKRLKQFLKKHGISSQ